MISTVPTSAPHPCSTAGCPVLVPRGAVRCSAHEKQEQANDRDRRGSAHDRGYGTKWRAARLAFLRAHPLCAECGRETPARVTAAHVVDHIVPHKGDQQLFWARSNWQSLCTPHHNSKTATEDGGFGRPVR